MNNKAGDKKQTQNGAGLFFLLIALTTLPAFLYFGAREVAFQRNVSFLQSLTPDKVATMELNNTAIHSREEINHIILSLNQVNSFRPNHDLERSLGVLRITTRDGEVRTFPLLRHARGVVIRFSFRGFVLGYIISTDLRNSPTIYRS